MPFCNSYNGPPDTAAMSPDALDDWLLDPGRRPVVVGVLNVTPDSFSDGGRFDSVAAAVGHARAMVGGGADWVDVGGESTRPGSAPVDAGEQVRRVVPVIEALRSLGVVVSVDTTRAEVAAAALDVGAAVVNDVSAGLDDPAMLPLVAARGCPVVLMHRPGPADVMQAMASYGDVVAEVADHLLARADAAVAAGVGRHRVITDAGIGFGKTTAHNLQLLRHLDRLTALPYPHLVGTSRKRFIGEMTGEPAADRRQFGTAATVALAVWAGASAVRVHDAREMRQVVDVVCAVRGA